MATNVSIRVPWHDAVWDGTVCRDPSANCHCADYENILRGKDVGYERSVAGKHLRVLHDLPPCADESVGFLSPSEWTLSSEHPYQSNARTRDTHGHLQRTSWTVERFTAQGVPFRWLRRGNVEEVAQPHIAKPLPPDDPLPTGFRTDWVFGAALQEAILDGFWNAVRAHESTAFFYTKRAQPISDDVSRLIVGIGDVAAVAKTRHYESRDPSKRKQPLWQRDIAHTLRAQGAGGLLVPYHDYLASTGDAAEDRRRRELARELVITPEQAKIVEFSYRTEHVSQDASISLLTQAIAVVARIRAHNLAEGDWPATETWLNARLGRAWQLRGPHPGLGPVLEAMGLRLGTSLVHLVSAGDPAFATDPWAAIAPVLDGRAHAPHPRFEADITAFRSLWATLSRRPPRMTLARILSSVALDATQARRWWDPDARKLALDGDISDDAIIANPYLLCELDRRTAGSREISFHAVDRATIATSSTASSISPSDRRRRRAAITAVLQERALDGDTLLGVSELKQAIAALSTGEPIDLPEGWLDAEQAFVTEHVRVLDGHPPAAQLQTRARVAGMLNRKLAARAKRTLEVPNEPWKELLITTVLASSPELSAFDPADERVAAALDEQVAALTTILSRKLTVLVGRAGTGKTTVLGALSRVPHLAGKVLMLAPTGKARVRLEARVAAGTDVMTVAQFLHARKRYDGARQQPIVEDDPCYDAHDTIVIDEASMLTEDALAAVLGTLKPPVQRLVLVGDPAQLPPIGPGRPFADLVAHLDPLCPAEDEDLDDLAKRRGALARLTHEVRSVAGQRSDTLRLASWFTDASPPPDAERIFAELTDRGVTLNDLDVRFWDGPDDLHAALCSVLQDYLSIGDRDLASFNRSFLMEPYKSGWCPNDPAGAETWQILSPVRRDLWGCDALNKWVQSHWRGPALSKAREYRTAFGPQEIIKHDKVILLRNGERDGYDSTTQSQFEQYLANGEVALVRTEAEVPTRHGTKKVKNLLFAGRPAHHTFGFFAEEFGGETAMPKVELAYALTVHKAQGSEFKVVVVVLPRGRMAYRELIYTALTRSRQRLVLLLQGTGVSELIELSKPHASDTIRRNSNLFRVAVREGVDRPFARHLLHAAADGTLLRSKSELFIYARCCAAGLKPFYEQRMDAPDGTWKWPDFTFADAAGDRIVWEHLGMLDRPSYAEEWRAKQVWYARQGLVADESLFWTDEVGGLQERAIDRVIEEIRKRV